MADSSSMTLCGTSSRVVHDGSANEMCIAMSFARRSNASVFATKSVSQLSSRSTPSFGGKFGSGLCIYAYTIPSEATRPVRLAASARPFSRRRRLAASRSPPASVSACLQSIIPAPVSSRSAFTSRALISVMFNSSSLRGSASRRLRGRLVGGVLSRTFVGSGRRFFVLIGRLFLLRRFLGLELQLPLRLWLSGGSGQDGNLLRLTFGLRLLAVSSR